ncbi:hypothetical protein JX266_008902 [Neoarthrinium moseri]|nr:hypothetical protein JX266_008902 [Neoarthrinium moseri]
MANPNGKHLHEESIAAQVARGIELAKNNVNLDGILLTTKGTDGELRSELLSHFISEEGRKYALRVPSNYDLEAIQRWYAQHVEVEWRANMTLVMAGDLVSIRKPEEFRILLARIERGKVKLLEDEQGSGLPVLHIMNSEPARQQNAPGIGQAGKEKATDKTADKAADKAPTIPAKGKETAPGNVPITPAKGTGTAPGNVPITPAKGTGTAPGNVPMTPSKRNRDENSNLDDSADPAIPGKAASKTPRREGSTGRRPRTGNDRPETPKKNDKGKEVARHPASDSEKDSDPDDSETDVKLPDNSVIIDAMIDKIDYKFSWENICNFFQCEKATLELKIPGLLRPVKDHQLVAIWAMLTQVTRTKLSTFLLGDAPGVGKSLEVIATFVIFHQIKSRWAQVVADRTAKRGNHLPWKGQDDESFCPSQNPFCFRCPCINSSDSGRIARSLPYLPTIVVAEAGVIPVWASELESHLDHDFQVEGVPSITATIDHNQYAQMWPQYSRPQFIAESKASVIEVQREGTKTRPVFKHKIQGRSGLTRNIIVVSRNSLNRFCQRFTEKRVHQEAGISKRNATYDALCLGASFIFFDEVHRYSGARQPKPGKGAKSGARSKQAVGERSETLKFMERLRKISTRPLMAVAVSGSILDDGPPLWCRFLEHAIYQASSLDWSFNLGNIKTVDELLELEKDWRFLEANYPDADAADTEKLNDINKRIEVGKKAYPNLLHAIMIARKKEDHFNGHPIVDLPPLQYEEIVLPTPAGAHLNALKRLTVEVKTWILKQLRKERNKWIQDGKKTAEPTIETVSAKHLGQAARKGLGEDNRPYLTIQRAMSFPALARIITEDSIKPEALASEEINKIAFEITKLLCAGAPKHNILAVLQNCFLWEYSSELEKSLKYKKICQIFNEVIEAGNQDFEKIEHLLLFMDGPLPAFVAFMLLFPTYCDKIDFYYFHAKLPQGAAGTRRSAKSNHCRNWCMKEINKPSEPGSKPRVLLLTYVLGAVGLNLQGANRVILCETPPRTADFDQAIGRVQRMGQAKEPKVVYLTDTKNIFELQRRIRIRTKKALRDMPEYREARIEFNDFVNRPEDKDEEMVDIDSLQGNVSGQDDSGADGDDDLSTPRQSNQMPDAGDPTSSSSQRPSAPGSRPSSRQETPIGSRLLLMTQARGLRNQSSNSNLSSPITGPGRSPVSQNLGSQNSAQFGEGSENIPSLPLTTSASGQDGPQAAQGPSTVPERARASRPGGVAGNSQAGSSRDTRPLPGTTFRSGTIEEPIDLLMSDLSDFLQSDSDGDES